MSKATYPSLVLMAALAAAGCARPPPLDQTISADSYLGFEMWRSRAEERLTAEQRKDFAAALWEISTEILAGRGPMESRNTDEEVRGRIDGETIREVLEHGYDSKLARLSRQAAALEGFIRENAELRPVDAVSADVLQEKHDQQVALLKSIDEQAESTQLKLDLLLGRPHVPRPPRAPLPQSPPPP